MKVLRASWRLTRACQSSSMPEPYFLPRPAESMSRLPLLTILTIWLFLGLPLHAGDRPQWGEALSRNMISPEKLLIESFDPKAKSQVKWCVPLGSITNGSPVIARGKVLVGTNNDVPRDDGQ